MARKSRHAPLQVRLNGRLVGVLRREPSGATDFTYAKAWLDWDLALPVSLSLPLREDRYIGAAVTAFFDNLLPDNADVRARIAGATGAGGTDAFSLLSTIGRDCVGALQFLPDTIAPDDVGVISGDPLTEADIAAIVKNLAQSPLGIRPQDDFRISIAGAQEKTALLNVDGVWMRPHGATPTTHILKPQIGKLSNGLDLSQSVENEHFCLAVLRALGFSTTESAIAQFEDVRVLSVTRFDRRWTTDGRLFRLPQEDFCQALGVPSSSKYESDGGPGMVRILNLLNSSNTPVVDQDAFLKAQYVYWLLGATDGHAKNFSIALTTGARFHMTPLYDVMSAQHAVNARHIPWNKYKLAMAVGAHRRYQINRIGDVHFVETGAQARMAPDRIRQLIADVREAIPAALDVARARMASDFPHALGDAIAAGVQRRLQTPFEDDLRNDA